MIPVSVNEDGLCPVSLRAALEGWEDIKTRPKVLYTISTAGNPTGVTTTTDRKKEIYAIAQEFDLLILEDDPYYCTSVAYCRFTVRGIRKELPLDGQGRPSP